MRIADIVAHHVEPGTVLIDLTEDDDRISPYAQLPPSFDVRHERRVSVEPRDSRPARAVVLQTLANARVDVDAAGAEVVNIVFAPDIGAVFGEGIVDRAAQAGWVLAGTHETQHPTHRVAVVLCASDVGDRRMLRAINEYRLQRLALHIFERTRAASEAEAQRRTTQISAERAKLERDLSNARAALAKIAPELARLRTACERAGREREESRREAAEQRVRAVDLERQLHATYKRLERTRGALSFRLGRATAIAAREARKAGMRTPVRWLQAFRGRDEILESLEPTAPTGRAELRGELTDCERATLERTYLLLGLDSPRGAGPGVAGVVGRRLGVELAEAARFSSLTPNGWRHQLDGERPALALVTSDGLAAGEAWGGYGTTDGRGAPDELAAMVDWCQAERIPVVYWDTGGESRSQLGLPRGIRVDAVFTISAALCQPGAAGDNPRPRQLLPALEPRIYHPLGAPSGKPREAVFAGAFDRRLPARELSALAALLSGARSRALRIFDAHHGEQGELAAATAFPESLRPHARPRRPAREEARTIKAAGLLLAHNTAQAADAPSWQLLRGIAGGAHVLHTPAQIGDAALAAAVRFAGDEASASDALAALAECARFDSAWEHAFARVLESYSLRDRLNAIARECGAASVAPLPPSVAVAAPSRSALEEFSRSQPAPPSNALAIDAAPLAVALAQIEASHVILYYPSAPLPRDAVAEVARLARMSDADAFALHQRDDGASALHHGGAIEGPTLIAVRRQVAIEQLPPNALSDPSAALRALEASGGRVLAKRCA